MFSFLLLFLFFIFFGCYYCCCDEMQCSLNLNFFSLCFIQYQTFYKEISPNQDTRNLKYLSINHMHAQQNYLSKHLKSYFLTQLSYVKILEWIFYTFIYIYIFYRLVYHMDSYNKNCNNFLKKYTTNLR